MSQNKTLFCTFYFRYQRLRLTLQPASQHLTIKHLSVSTYTEEFHAQSTDKTSIVVPHCNGRCWPKWDKGWCQIHGVGWMKYVTVSYMLLHTRRLFPPIVENKLLLQPESLTTYWVTIVLVTTVTHKRIVWFFEEFCKFFLFTMPKVTHITHSYSLVVNVLCWTLKSRGIQSWGFNSLHV